MSGSGPGARGRARPHERGGRRAPAGSTGSSRPRTPATADLAALAARLTARDRQLCRLLHEHRVFTTDQVTALLFWSANAAQHRLLVLARLGIVDRFRPLLAHGQGSAPWHYVLGPAGAAVLAAEQATTADRLGYRRDRVLAVAHSQRLGHLVGVNGFFAALAGDARRRPDAALAVWLSERQCADRWGHVVRPDGYGRWRHGPHRVDFFLEYDNGTEPLDRVLAKLEGYAELAAATQTTAPAPVLLWLPGPGRETTLRAALGDRPPVPVATATARGGTHPAAAVWLPAPGGGPRRPLAALAAPGRPAGP